VSIRATKWAWSLQLPATVKLVLVALSDHADEDGECWPSQARIASMTGLTDRAVRYVMHGLKASGLIRIETSRGRQGCVSLAFDVEEITPEIAGIVARECASTSKKKPKSDAPDRNEIPKNRNEIPTPRNEIPIHRTIKNHQEPSLPPKTPTGLRLVRTDRDMRFRGKGQDEEVRIPDFIPLDAWNGFLEMRKRKGVKETAHAVRLLIGKLQAFFAAGHDVAAILDESTMRSWTGVFEPKGQSRGSIPAKPKSALAQQAERMRQQFAQGGSR